LAWTIEYSEPAKKTLKRLDRQTAKRILDFMDTRVALADNPRRIGKALQEPLDRYWAFRVGDYRAICELNDDVLNVLVLKIGHRSDVYR
jgi:mRNA interferase RelE/StbE